MTITLQVTAIDLETVLACLRFRAHIIGDATARDRAEQSRLYSLAAGLDLQSTTLTQPREEQTQ